MDDNKNDKNSPTQNNFLSSVDNITIGPYLKSKREKKNLTIKHISQFTKINPTQIELLEKDFLIKLPNKAYVVGYIKAYAKAIGIPLEEALFYLEKTYREQAPQIPSSPLKSENNENTEKHEVTPSQSKTQKLASIKDKFKESHKEKIILIGIAGIMIAITSLALLFKKVAHKDPEQISSEKKSGPVHEKTPTATVTKIPTTTPTPVPTLIPTLVPTITPTKAPVSTPLPTPVPEKTQTPAPIEKAETPPPPKMVDINIYPDLEILKNVEQFSTPLQRPAPNQEELKNKPTNEITSKSDETDETKKQNKTEDKKDDKKKSPFYKIRLPLYQITDNPELTSKIPANVKESIVHGKQNVFISTESGRTWITYKVDKEPIKQIFLKENASVLISGSEVRLFLGNASAANVYLNNRPVDMQLKRGIKNLIFPESSASKFAVPLFIFDEAGTISPSDEYMKKKGLTAQ